MEFKLCKLTNKHHHHHRRLLATESASLWKLQLQSPCMHMHFPFNTSHPCINPIMVAAVACDGSLNDV